ncbi:MAG: bifunctional DNA primase/polymerase, partial [Pyrinomonadaceae bacterium]
CKAVLKHPIASNWQHSPQDWSDDQLEVMQLSGQLDTGYGVLCTGLLVIDVDERNGGVASFERLAGRLGGALMSCGLIVKTGSGGGSRHYYYKAPQGVPLMAHHADYPGIDFKSSGFVVGPGSLHASGNRYEAVQGSPEEIDQAPAELLELLRKPEHFRASYNGEAIDVTEQELADMLSYIDNNCDHETWYRCGMAVHHATGGTGFAIWDDWSNGGETYPGRSALERRWHSFGKSANPVTLGTLMRYAEDAGWHSPVTFEATVDFEQAKDGLPFPIEGVDLLRPPGFVGEVCRWVNDQCRYPREHLAVATTLVAMGNVCGLRYTDDLDGASANLFAFCVAGSATGKEAVQQAMAEIHRAAGIHVATHGAIKSEQEIVRNLIRNQAALYIIDEIGIFLQKVANAQQRGGAAYLDGVIGMLMAAYSKADGFMLLTGDTKDEVRKALIQELAQCRKAVSENEDKSGAQGRRVPQLERALENIDNGLDRPFLSMVGFTTPVTFNGLVTAEQATNGFIGRSLLTEEKETSPRAKRGFKKLPMSEQMRHAIAGLYMCGEYDPQNRRVEYYGTKAKIKTTPVAATMLGLALDWLEAHAELHKEKTGLEAVVRRGYEIMAKISLILAAPEGVRTEEHVRWAFAMVKRDIETKTRLAYANMREKDSPLDALRAKILSIIDQDHGESQGVIVNRCRKWGKLETEKMLAKLEEEGEIERRTETHPINGKESFKFFAV